MTGDFFNGERKQYIFSAGQVPVEPETGHACALPFYDLPFRGISAPPRGRHREHHRQNNFSFAGRISPCVVALHGRSAALDSHTQ